MRLHFVIIILGIAALSPLSAKDWPTYRANASRDGYTSDILPSELSLRWKWKSSLPPHSAWPRSQRMVFDRLAEDKEQDRAGDAK